MSYLFYGPYNSLFYNSYHAIHVLMAADFQLPRDYYYWGQNRLGSLLPLCAFLFGKIICLQPIYLCAVVHYFFLFIGFIILSRLLSNHLSIIGMCAIIFLPVSEYSALTMIGHPYSSQLFAGTLFLYFLARLRNSLLKNQIENKNRLLICLAFTFFALMFYFLGVWVSEFNALLVIIPSYYLLSDKELKKSMATSFKFLWFKLLAFLTTIVGIVGCILYFSAKSFASIISTDNYNHFFITKTTDICKNFSFFLAKLKTSLFFIDDAFVGNLFNWMLIVFILLSFYKKKSTLIMFSDEAKILFNSLLLFCVISSSLLFLSSWNFRSEFSPRYFTPIYIVFCFATLFFLDKSNASNRFEKLFFPAAIFLCCTVNCFQAAINKPFLSTMNKYSDFKNLRPGTLIGDYWDVYKVNSIAFKNLKSIPFDKGMVRNWAWKEDALSAYNFYFLNVHLTDLGLNNTIHQHGEYFKFSGEKFNCNGMDVWLYHKTTTNSVSY